MTAKNIMTFSSLIVVMLFAAFVMQHADAAGTKSCPLAGQNNESRCYATKTYIPNSMPSSVSVDVAADDISVMRGFLQNALWSFLSDDRFIEAGFLDQSSDSEKIVCGEHGNIDESSTINFSDGHKFNVYVYELRDGVFWKIGIKHINSGMEKSCVTMSPMNTYMIRFIIGSEASRPDNPNYEHEWDDLKINYQNAGSGSFSSVWIAEYGPDYDVEECGSGERQYRNIQTGKGDISPC